jgi:peptidoglycan/LPS O-acetylase OafA/YrhL
MLNALANKFRRITSNQLYLAELDGMRFLSLSLVTLFHIRGYLLEHLEKTQTRLADSPGDYFWFNRFFDNADRSVPLFFAISGFILATPFAHHFINHGKKIDLKQYYLRRLTRLEPPYFIVMICIFFAQIVVGNYDFQTLLPSLGASLIYSHDFIFHQTPLVTVVAWTLEVEVQFYTTAPILFRIFSLPRIGRRLILAAGIVAFVVLQYFYPPTFLSIYGHAQHFLIGILLADFYVCGFAIDFFKQKWVAIFAPVIFLTMFLMPRWEQTFPPFERAFDPAQLAMGIAFPFLLGLLYYIILRNEIVKKVFSYKFIPIIGGMCYTIYLIHYTVISMLGRFTVQVHFTDYYIPNLLLQFVLLIIPILLISSVFYLYIERPFMSKKWIDKLMKKDKHKAELNPVVAPVDKEP